MARLICEDIKNLAGDAAAAGRTWPISVYIDEAARAVYEGFGGLITQCRSAGIELTLATQSPLDFRCEEGDVLQAVLQNTNTKLLMRQLDARKRPASRRSDRHARSHRRDQAHQCRQPRLLRRRLGSARLVREYVVSPDQIRAMPTGQAAFIQQHRPRGRGVITVRRSPKMEASVCPSNVSHGAASGLGFVGRLDAASAGRQEMSKSTSDGHCSVPQMVDSSRSSARDPFDPGDY